LPRVRRGSGQSLMRGGREPRRAKASNLRKEDHLLEPRGGNSGIGCKEGAKRLRDLAPRTSTLTGELKGARKSGAHA